MTSSTTTHRAGIALAAGLLGTGVALAPAAGAQAEGRDVQMAFPLGGDHTIRFGALTVCRVESDAQLLSANAIDMNALPQSNPFDLSAAMFPFNSATVEWTNHATGKTGTQTVQTTGHEVGVRDLDTGVGDLTVKVTVTRSALPTLAPGSVAPMGTATHSETFEVAGVGENCGG